MSITLIVQQIKIVMSAYSGQKEDVSVAAVAKFLFCENCRPAVVEELTYLVSLLFIAVFRKNRQDIVTHCFHHLFSHEKFGFLLDHALLTIHIYLHIAINCSQM